MPLRRLVLLFLILSLCLSASCTPGGNSETGRGDPTNSAAPPGITVSPPPSAPPVEDILPATPVPTPEPTPEPPVGPAWDSAHQLNIDLIPVKAGRLELPIYGATGYTTVTLPIWAEIPPAPPPSPAPAASQSAAVAAALPESAPPVEAPPAEHNALPPAETPVAELPPLPTGDTAQPPVDTPIAEPLPSESSPPAPPSPDPGSTPSPSPIVPPPSTPTPTPTPDPFAGAKAVLPAGTPFTILEERGDWWWIKSSMGKGWIANRYCMINLPDVIPSIVYDATNSYQSLYTTSGLPLPGITGEALYTGKVHNPRFDEEQFLMPVLYDLAKKLCQAQQNALAEGNSIKLYEGYRPYQVQKAVYKAITDMAKTNPVVKQGVETGDWKPFWFIASGYSNHQRGYAIDISLVKVTSASHESVGEHTYLKVNSYEEYQMPTKIHELSVAAATFTEPVDSYSQTAWKKAILSPSMNPPALGLQRYCTDAGLVPLASEWWHFNDIQAWSKSKDNPGTGSFEIKQVLSLTP